MLGSHRTTRVLATAAALVALPAGSALAQSCIGFPLQPNQMSLAMTINEAGEFGGIGPTFSMVTKKNLSIAAQFTQHDVEVGSAEYEKMTFWSAKAARPVFRSKSWGAHKSGLGGTCGVLEAGGSSFQGNGSNFVGGGVGYGLAHSRFAVYGAPVLGMAFAENANDSFFKLMLGASVRLRMVYLGWDINMPIEPSGQQNVQNVRFGYAWGRATQLPATPVKTGAAVTQQAEAANAGGTPTPTAGLKPYALEDIEGMLKNGVATARILDLSKRACLSFRLNDETDTRLRRLGADPELLTGLRQSCYSAN